MLATFTILAKLSLAFVVVLFLVVRWGFALPLLNAAVTPLRSHDGWRSQHMEEAGASQTVLNTRCVLDRGWRRPARIGVTATLLLLAAVTAAFVPAPVLVGALLGHGILDAFKVLASPSPAAALTWTEDRYGIPCGVQESQCRTHVVFTGGVSLACYACGVLEFLFDRYGYACFRECDFAGASSGSWAAGCAVFAAHAGVPVHEFFDLIFISAVSLIDMFPLGLLFIGCQAVQEFTALGMAAAQARYPAAHKAVVRENRLGVWLFGFSLRRKHTKGRAYRLLVRSGPDFHDGAKLGALLSATSVFPYFTCPRLSSSLHCMTAAMDGYFPGKGIDSLPVPDMAIPAAGKGGVLLFDMSGGMKERYAGDDRVHVVDLRSWEDFGFRDWAASSPEAVRDLFARGLRGAERHASELDAAMSRTFGLAIDTRGH